MSKLYIVCVIYNIQIKDIVSLNSFKAIAAEKEDIQIIIFDNSDNLTIHIKNAEDLENTTEITYIYNGGNIGISKSFNKAVSLVEDRDAWIMFSDDDTDISYAYLSNLYNKIWNTNNEIVSGIVRSNNKVMSPIKKYKLFNDDSNFINSTGVYSSIYCINSCLCVKRSVFDVVRYNEDIFLDLADFMFMDELIDNKLNTIEIIDGEIHQEFSGDTRVYVGKALSRYRIFRKDFKTYCKSTNKGYMFMIIMLLKHFLKIILTSKYYIGE